MFRYMPHATYAARMILLYTAQHVCGKEYSATYLLSDAGREVNAQIYSVVGRRISVWNQPREVRSMFASGQSWTPEEIEEVLPRTIQQEINPFIEDLERRMKEMASEEGK